MSYGPVPFLERLRRANVRRANEWPGNERITLEFRGLEAAGEAGELANLVKKLARIRNDIHGTSEEAIDLLEALRDEAADVVIAVDLLCMHLGIELQPAIAAKFNATSRAKGLTTTLDP